MIYPPAQNVQHVTVLAAETLDPALPGFGIGTLALAVDRNQRRFDVRLHFAAVAADEDDRPVLDQPPDAILLGRDQILHVGFRPLAARERRI